MDRIKMKSAITVPGIDLGSKPRVHFYVRIDAEIVIMMSIIKNSWVVETCLYNQCVFCSAPNFLLGSREGKWVGKGEGVIIFEN